MVGWSDLPADLSDTAAIARLSAYLPDGVVISSDLSRAIATADVIAGRRRLPHDPDLREINFGAWELQHFADVPDQDLIRRYWEEPGDVSPPGGESWNTVCARVNDAVDRLCAHQGDVIVVAHFGVILTQVQRALGIGAYAAMSHRIDNLSVTEITWDGGWTSGRINFIP
tara:strand:+ start:8655 stop:9164 length:510 start_codon:yes stop_codon:yes gene_type:complete